MGRILLILKDAGGAQKVVSKAGVFLADYEQVHNYENLDFPHPPSCLPHVWYMAPALQA